MATRWAAVTDRWADRPTLPFLVSAVAGLVTVWASFCPWASYHAPAGNESLSVDAVGGWCTLIPITALVAVVLTLAVPLVRPAARWPTGFGWLLRLVATACLVAVVVSLFQLPAASILGLTEPLTSGLHASADWGAWVGLAGASVLFLAALVAGEEG